MKSRLRIKKKCFSVPAGRFNLCLGAPTLIMGIINLTPDSFSHDGLFKSGIKRSLLIENTLRLARKMAKDGADIIDIGAESTRPGARSISAKEERKRIIPVIAKIVQCLDIPISVDTYKPEVAKAAICAGASIINNIMGTNMKFTKKIARMCAQERKALILMHIRGRPSNMQRFIKYKSLIFDIIRDLKKALSHAQDAGLNLRSTIIDPGIGFAKTAGQNLEILNSLDEFRVLQRPILVGVSRKSFIGKVLNLNERERIFGTSSCVALAIASGAHIVRVHDVKEMRQVVHMSDAILNSGVYN